MLKEWVKEEKPSDEEISDRLAAAHFHEESHSPAAAVGREEAELPAGKVERRLLVQVRPHLDRHREGGVILIRHSDHPRSRSPLSQCPPQSCPA